MIFNESGEKKIGYFNYHAVARRLIAEGKLLTYYFAEEYHGISPALLLVFDDARHPVMPIREARWEEYLSLLRSPDNPPAGHPRP